MQYDVKDFLEPKERAAKGVENSVTFRSGIARPTFETRSNYLPLSTQTKQLHLSSLQEFTAQTSKSEFFHLSFTTKKN